MPGRPLAKPVGARPHEFIAPVGELEKAQLVVAVGVPEQMLGQDTAAELPEHRVGADVRLLPGDGQRPLI